MTPSSPGTKRVFFRRMVVGYRCVMNEGPTEHLCDEQLQEYAHPALEW